MAPIFLKVPLSIKVVPQEFIPIIFTY